VILADVDPTAVDGALSQAALAAELTACGAKVTVATGDLADADVVAGIVAQIPVEYPLTAVVHVPAPVGAGATASAAVASLHRIAAPAVMLDAATRQMGLAAFVVCSPAADALGIPGGGDDAAAHAVLEAVVAGRRRAGLAAAHVALGESSDVADEVLAQAVERVDGIAVVADLAWPETAATMIALGRPHLCRGLAQARPLPRSEPVDELDDTLRQRLSHLDAVARLGALEELVRSQTAALLGHTDVDMVDAQDNFVELGLSSITALELSNRLRAHGFSVAPMVIFDNPNSRALAGFLCGSL